VKRAAVLVLSLLLAGAACTSTTSASAASVNGNKLSTDDLVEELNAIQANPDYITALQSGQPSNGITVVGSKPGSFDAAFVSQVLLRQLDYSLIRSEIAKRKVAISDACRRQARDDAMLNLGQQNAQAGQALFTKFPKRYQDLLVDRNTDVLALEAVLNGQTCGQSLDAQSYYDAHKDQFTKQCISLIAVPDQATADNVVAQARAGADFASLVQQYSVDPTSKAQGGAVGCLLVDQFNPSVASLVTGAKVGDVLDPLPGQGGVSILKLTDRQVAPFSEVQSQAAQLAQSSSTQAFGSWLQEARANAKVTVDPRYGTFDPSKFQITPPALDLNSGSSGASPASSSTDNP
jgi:parvulin-like peptidyl-prolyl isomerase